MIKRLLRCKLFPVLLPVFSACDRQTDIYSLDTVMQEVATEINRTSTKQREARAEIVNNNLRIVYRYHDVNADEVDMPVLRRTLKSEMIKVSCRKDAALKSILVAGRVIDYTLFLQDDVPAGSFSVTHATCAKPNNLADFID